MYWFSSLFWLLLDNNMAFLLHAGIAFPPETSRLQLETSRLQQMQTNGRAKAKETLQVALW